MISTHILDTTRGMPASGVEVTLEINSQGEWKVVGTDSTNSDGRIVFNCPKIAGCYRLTFHVEDYYAAEEHFFLNTPILFKITNTERKYHVPLLLNPYSYSTYRGS